MEEAERKNEQERKRKKERERKKDTTSHRFAGSHVEDARASCLDDPSPTKALLLEAKTSYKSMRKDCVSHDGEFGLVKDSE